MISSKMIPIGWVDLNSKMNFAICHWSWEIGCIWHFLRKSGDITLFFLEQYIFKTKSSKNLQSLLYHSDLNICQDQCTQGSAGLLKKTYFCTSVCVFVSSQQSKIEFDFQIMKIFKTVKSNFLQNWKVLILFINWSGFVHSNQHFKITCRHRC